MYQNSSSPGVKQTQTIFPSSLSSVGSALMTKSANEIDNMINASFDIDSLIVFMVYKDICETAEWIKEKGDKLATLPRIEKVTAEGKLVLEQISDESLGSNLAVAGRLIEGGFMSEVDSYIDSSPSLSRLLVYHMFGCPFESKTWCAAVSRELQGFPSFAPFIDEP